MLLVANKETIMKNNGYVNWKIATVFLCIVSFTSSASCRKRPLLTIAQKAINATYAIETPEDAQKVLGALACIDAQEAITAIVKLAPFFSQGSDAFISHSLFIMEFNRELNGVISEGAAPSLEQQMYLLSAAMLDERYKNYRTLLTHLETSRRESLLLYVVFYALPEMVIQLTPIYHEADRLNTRSDEGFNALSIAVANALTGKSSLDRLHSKQIVFGLINEGASPDGPINYQSTENLKDRLAILNL